MVVAEIFDEFIFTYLYKTKLETLEYSLLSKLKTKQITKKELKILEK